MKLLTLIIFLLSAVAITSCSTSNPYADLDAFMAEVRAKPGGIIKPIPTLKAYQPFNYSASGLRSPFVRPVQVQEVALLQAGAEVVPDFNRQKEYLEDFSLDSLRMVGSIEMSEIQWALIRDSEGGVYRVKEGNYLGRNHGQIVELTENYVTLIEIVSNGGEGWVERPRTISLQESAGG